MNAVTGIVYLMGTFCQTIIKECIQHPRQPHPPELSPSLLTYLNAQHNRLDIPLVVITGKGTNVALDSRACVLVKPDREGGRKGATGRGGGA